VFLSNKLERYIGGQLLHFLGISITLVTLIVFFSDTLFDFIKEMQDLGMPLGLAMQFLILQVPTALAFAFPPSIFLTVLMIYTQLNQSFELIAMRMNANRSLWSIFSPALILSLMMAGLTFFSTEILVPAAQFRMDMLREEVLTSSQLKLNKDGITLPIFKDGKWIKLINAEQASKNALKGLTFVQRSESGNIEVIQAEDAQYRDAQWQLQGVRIFASLPKKDRFVVNRMANLQKSQLLSIDSETLEDVRLGFHHSKLSFFKLRQYIKDQLAAGEDVAPKLYTKVWERIAQPINCMALVLVAFPLALAAPRQSASRGFLFAIAALFTLYIVRAVFISMGQGGLLSFGGLLNIEQSIALACISPGVIIAVIGIGLIQKKSYTL
jgi:lipopolysaccharide export system permease protein